MKIDKEQFNGMSSRQKATSIGIVVVVLIILWQVIGLFSGGSTPEQTTLASKTNGAQNGGAPQPVAPQSAQLNTQPVSSEQQNELRKLQQEMQTKYVYALNDLQMLKIIQQIQETNRAIANAKFDTVSSEKKIVELLSPPAPVVESQRDYAGGLVPATTTTTTTSNVVPAPVESAATTAPVAAPAPQPAPAMAEQAPAKSPIASYVVISVSELLNRWGAVLGYQGKLYSVFIGDVMPPDGAVVSSIDKYSVVLEKDGVKKKISLVPII